MSEINTPPLGSLLTMGINSVTKLRIFIQHIYAEHSSLCQHFICSLFTCPVIQNFKLITMYLKLLLLLHYYYITLVTPQTIKSEA
jgi:hypothetical protein